MPWDGGGLFITFYRQIEVCEPKLQNRKNKKRETETEMQTEKQAT